MPESATLDLSDLPDQIDLSNLPDKEQGFDLSDLPDKINVTGEPRGGFGEFTQGLDLATVPRDVAESLTPLTGALHDLKTSSQALYDVLSGSKSISDAALARYGDTRGLIGIEKKPIRERVATGLETAMQMLFAKEIAKGMPKAEVGSRKSEVGTAPIDTASLLRDLPDETIPEPPAEGAPSVAIDHLAKQLPVEQTQTVPAPAGDVFAVPTREIASRPELMQFKKIEDQTTGTNEADRITAPYNPNFAGLLQLWEPSNPQEYGLTNEQRYIVANGHHRNAAATEQGVETQNAQIFRESAGVSAGDARTIAAESNISDGKGTIYDQTKFIRNFAATHGPDAALERAGQIGARGRKAATIAVNAGPDLYTSFVNEQISPDAAASIADVAAGNIGLQRLGIQRAAKGDEPAAIYNFIQAAQAQMGDAAPDATQVDLFGSNDVALQAAEQMAKRAGAIQKEIGEQIGAVQGAAKRPEKARSLGVDVSDPSAVNVKLAQLKELRERARTWAMDTQIRDLAMSDMSPQDAVETLAKAPGGTAESSMAPAPGGAMEKVVPALSEQVSTEPVAATSGEVAKPAAAAPAELFKPAEIPFNLSGEALTHEPSAEGAARAAAESEFRQKKEQELFGFGPGAASAGEKLASYEKRKFGERFQADIRMAQEIRDNTGNRYYEPIANTVTADEATGIVGSRPITETMNAVRDEQNGIPFHVRSTMGQLVIQRLNKAYRTLKEAGANKDAELMLNHAIDMAEWQQEFGTRLGQGVQSFAMWQRLTPEGRLVSVQRMVRKTRDRYTAAHQTEIDEITGALSGDKTDAERFAALKKLFGTNATARKAKPHLQKLIDAAKTGKFTDQTFYDIAGERLGLPKYDKGTAAEIMRLALKIDEAPEGLPRDQATLELQHFIATKMGFRPSDLPVGIYYGNMLSGYNTQLVNTLDTLVNVMSEMSGLSLANPRAAAKIFNNTLKGFVEGRADFLLALTKGRMLTDSKWLEVPRLMEVARFGEKGGVPIRTETNIGRILKRVTELRPAKVLNAWKYVTRLMAASDSVMFRGAKEGRMALLADRLARDEGLHGRALNRRVRELLGRTEDQATEFRKQAEAEGFGGLTKVAREIELRERVRSASASADATDFAGIATYNHEPQGLLGYLATGIGRASNRFPLLKIFVPFTRIVANVTNRGLNYTPWGFKRALYGYSGDIGRPEGDAQAMLIARATLGTAGLTTLLAMQAGGLLDISGAGPTDPDRRKQLQESGWRPYTLKIGKHYWSYIYTPLGLGLSILGNMSDSYRYRELEQKDAMTRGVYAISRIGSTVFSQSFLSGLSNLFGALSSSGPGEALSSLRRTVQSTAGTITTPRIVTDVQRLFDPTRYDSNSLAQDLLKNTPFAAITNKPTLNAFGEPVKMPTNRFVSPVTKDLAWEVVTGANLRVPVPDKYTDMPDGRGGKRQITPDEYYDYLAKTGPEIREWIVIHAIQLSSKDREQAQKELSQRAEEIREGVLRRMRSHAKYNPVD